MGLVASKIWAQLVTLEEVRILLVGLDAAGKTTILYKLKLNETVPALPTIGFNVETIKYKNMNFTMWDVGGQDKIRSLWKFYFSNTQGVIFVVDSSDRERLTEARRALHDMMDDARLSGAALLVLANKADVPGAMTPSQLVDQLQLHALIQEDWCIQATCALKGVGLYEGLGQFAGALKRRHRAALGSNRLLNDI